MDNLGPLSRSHHRAKTFGRWRLRQPTPGSYVWRSPYGWVYLVTASGSWKLGNDAFTAAVWKAAVRCHGSADQPISHQLGNHNQGNHDPSDHEDHDRGRSSAA